MAKMTLKQFEALYPYVVIKTNLYSRYSNFVNDYNITSYYDTIPMVCKGQLETIKVFNVYDINHETLIYDHLTRWRTSDGREIIISQPYYDKSNKTHLVDAILNGFLYRDLWNYFIKYSYNIDIYLYDKYNWWSDDVVSIIFTHDILPKSYHERHDINRNELIINVHDIDEKANPIITPYVIKLGINK